MRVHLCFLLAILAPSALRLQFRCESCMLRAVETREAFTEWQDMMLPFPQEHGQSGDRGVGGGWRVSRIDCVREKLLENPREHHIYSEWQTLS